MERLDDMTLVPHTPIRRRIARHMLASSGAAAHAYAMSDVDYGSVDDVRSVLGQRWRQEYGYSLTYLPFVARAVAIGISRYGYLNGRFTDDGLEVRREIGLGIAVDMTFEGLIVPVIPQAELMSVPQLAAAIHDLTDRTRQGKLTGGDVTGGTFTLSNPGPFGARATLPIINHPQVAIMTVDSIAPRPAVATGDGGVSTVTVRPIGNLTLAWDHRAFDGAYAASALVTVRDALEFHDWRSEFGASWFSGR